MTSTPSPEAAPALRIALDEDAAELLRDTIGEDNSGITLSVGEGADGYGLHVWLTEYPEEGSIFLVETPADPTAPAADAWVPIHPQLGPLWSMTTATPDPERLPQSYPLRAVTFAPPAVPAAQDERLAAFIASLARTEFYTKARLEALAAIAQPHPRPEIQLQNEVQP